MQCEWFSYGFLLGFVKRVVSFLVSFGFTLYVCFANICFEGKRN